MSDHHERLCYRLRQGTSDTVHAGPEAALVIEHQQQGIRQLLAHMTELQQWKREGMAVISQWDDAFAQSGIVGVIGQSKSALMIEEMHNIARRNTELRKRLAELDVALTHAEHRLAQR